MPSGISCIDAWLPASVWSLVARLIDRSMQRCVGSRALDRPTGSGVAWQGLDGKAPDRLCDAVAQKAGVLPDFKWQKGGVKNPDASLRNFDPGPSTRRNGCGRGQDCLTQLCLTPFQARDFRPNFGKVISKAQTVHPLLPFTLCSVRMSDRLVNDRYLSWSFP